MFGILGRGILFIHEVTHLLSSSGYTESSEGPLASASGSSVDFPQQRQRIVAKAPMEMGKYGWGTLKLRDWTSFVGSEELLKDFGSREGM